MSENRAERLTYYLHDEAAAFRFQLAGHLSKNTAADLDQARETAFCIRQAAAHRGFNRHREHRRGRAPIGREMARPGHAVCGHNGTAKKRMRSMTGVPFCLLGNDRSEWLPGRLLLWFLAAVTVFSFGAAVMATHRASDLFEALRNGLSISLVEQSR
jgi:hypothetical protein